MTALDEARQCLASPLTIYGRDEYRRIIEGLVAEIERNNQTVIMVHGVPVPMNNSLAESVVNVIDRDERHIKDAIAHALDESLEPRNRLQGIISRIGRIPMSANCGNCPGDRFSHEYDCQAPDCLQQQEPVDDVIRDLCELEPADPESPDSVCVSVQDLQRILNRHYTTPPSAEARARECRQIAWDWGQGVDDAETAIRKLHKLFPIDPQQPEGDGNGR